MENNDSTALVYFEKALTLDPDNMQIQQYIMLARQRMGK
jgi:hypothetical protein